ncbi:MULTISPECIES: C45 family autoproteolytic acyltransferase/hydolase [unclassified Anaeromyxobacter]|uniref:C45 family autoproteolytic acyltransferase/hydolase n=1 Tax=unclassified Anaeromyxobacter TaxID=2620896 RepID=UPI001F5AE56F|nr:MULTISPECIES: C45 family autoproteolytic acyltransferase/hydolase [unclassified Anaeromyxobacter]
MPVTALLASALAAAPALLSLQDPGFEAGAPGAPPPAWTVRATEGARVAVTDAARATGARALAITAPASGAEVTVASAPVRLEVGKLYRLSAWVRTRGVRADPLARYPTALGACVAMASTPFTNCSPQAPSSGEGRLSLLFFALAPEDRVALHLGRNGRATGEAVFDDVRLEPVDDVTEYVPLETVRWEGEGFRYDDGGWIFVHVEGEPYARGAQYGALVADELARFLAKVAVQHDKADPERGWNDLRRLTDALMLRKFDAEYLEEMKGIADGAAKAGARWKGRPLDLLDVAALNSAVDLGQLDDALQVSRTPLSGRSFVKAEDETAQAEGDRCSSFVATRSATRSGRFVMGQLFMWNGYTGVHWDVVLDVVPAKGHRLVMQTFPGGIHSGSDWYLNGAGMVIGETTVGQTPFEPAGTPQSNRIRKAAQYGSSIDEVAALLRAGNNGLYSNDWTIADAKTDEGACLLLGTKASRLWRTGARGRRGDTPGGLRDFVWANNNARDPAVRRELTLGPGDAPVDVNFPAWNRDIAFQQFYREHGRGGIDLEAGVRLWASSPLNRPHACDGKLTTAEMAEKLVFLAHYGKTTLREKWVGGRWIPADLPDAIPHLTLGYTTFSPIVVADGLARARAAREARPASGAAAAPGAKPKPDLAGIAPALAYDPKLLWKDTVFPATDADAWFTSGSAAYHALLAKLPEEPAKALEALRAGLDDLSARLAWLTLREGAAAPARLSPAYDRYGPYQIPRIRGTFALHQLRLRLGNAAFAKGMRAVHERYAGKPMRTEDFLRTFSAAAGQDVAPFVRPWLERADLPDPVLSAVATRAGDRFRLAVEIAQKTNPWPFVSTLAIRGEKTIRYERIEVPAAATRTFTFELSERPQRVALGGDAAVGRDDAFVLPNLLDDFPGALFVWGSSRQVEAGHSLALVWRDTVADAFTEVLPPLAADAEVSDADLAEHDLVVLGGAADNALVARLAREGKLPFEAGRGFFRWDGTLHGRADEGLAIALRNPWNPSRGLYLYLANSRLQLWQMTHAWQRGLPGWTSWRGPEVVERGHLGTERLEVAVKLQDPAAASAAAR